MKHRRKTLTLLAALLLTILPDALGDEEAANLFEPATPVTQGMAVDPHALQVHPVTVDLGLLAELTPPREINLNLAQMAWYTGVVEQVDRRSATQFTVAGYLPDTPHGSFIIVVEHGVAVGLIQDPVNGLLFRLRYTSNGVQVISEVDSESYGRCGNEELPTGTPPGTSTPQETSDEECVPDTPPNAVPARGCVPPQPVFDMMIVYTEAARLAAGGTYAMNAECQLALEIANQAYINSDIDARMRIVYRGEIDYDEDGTLDDHLDRLTGTSDGYMDSVHTLRNTYGADIVSLFVEDADGWCGLARCLPNTAERAFNVVQWSCAAGNFSYVHGVGHNQGCAHDREHTDPDVCNTCPYSYGWRFNGDTLFSTYRTVMAYSPGTRIQYFSNPDVEFDGRPTGIPVGDPDEAHNAQTINLRRSIIEDHRLTRFDIWVDFAYGGAEQGTFSMPYDTVAEGASNIVDGVGASELPNLWIKAGSSSETVTINSPMVIRSCGGLVTIGN